MAGLPKPQAGEVYEIWLKRGNQLEPGPLFNVDVQGKGAGAIPDDLDGVLSELESGSDPPVYSTVLVGGKKVLVKSLHLGPISS